MSAVGPDRSKMAPTLMSSLVAPEDDFLEASLFLSLPQDTPAPASRVKQSGRASLLRKRFILVPLWVGSGLSSGRAIFGSSPWPAARAAPGREARTAGTRRVRGRTA